MTLYTFYNDGEKFVFGTFAEGETQFFYSGFENKEDAKAATKGLHLALKRKNRPNTPFNILECEVDMILSGIWSKIE